MLCWKYQIQSHPTVLHCTTLLFVLYCTVRYCTTLYCTSPRCTLLPLPLCSYCVQLVSVLFCSVVFYSVLFICPTLFFALLCFRLIGTSGEPVYQIMIYESETESRTILSLPLCTGLSSSLLKELNLNLSSFKSVEIKVECFSGDSLENSKTPILFKFSSRSTLSPLSLC